MLVKRALTRARADALFLWNVSNFNAQVRCAAAPALWRVRAVVISQIRSGCEVSGSRHASCGP